MQDFDNTLKLLITESADTILPMLGASAGVKQWINVELPKTQNLRVDLLAELTSGELRHIELQSTNTREMPFRMLEYAVAIYRNQSRYPAQILLYVGDKPLRMKNYFREPGLDFHYEVIDLKTLDGTALLNSGNLSANLLSLLMVLKDKTEAIRRIIGRIQKLDETKRRGAVIRLLLTCGMRKLEHIASMEIKKMPVRLIDFKGSPFIDMLLREGEKRGRRIAADNAKKQLVRLLIRKRFGRVPAWANERMAGYSTRQIDGLALRILNGGTLQELFRVKNGH